MKIYDIYLDGELNIAYRVKDFKKDSVVFIRLSDNEELELPKEKIKNWWLIDRDDYKDFKN